MSKAGDTIGSKQPPQAERERYETVTGQIDEAASLVSTARIAVVDRETERYDALADRLADAAEALSSSRTTSSTHRSTRRQRGDR